MEKDMQLLFNFKKIQLSLPSEYLAGKESHDIYYLIYKTHFPEFNSIPTTSTLGNCDGNAIKYFDDGIEPKNARKPLYEKALNNYISDEQTWNKNIYNKATSLQVLTEKENNFTKSFIDFEAYIRYLQKIIRNEP